MLGTRSGAVMAVTLGLALSPWVARAEPPTSLPVSSAPAPDDELRALRECVERADFQAAEPRLKALLASPDLSAREHNLALELSAVIALAARREAEAQRTLAELYARDPGHRLSVAELGPQVSAAFERAARAPQPPAELKLHAGLGRAPDGRATLDVQLDDPTRRSESVHAYLWFESAPWLSHLVAEGGARARFLLPEAPPGAARVAVHVEARAPSGVLLGALATRAEPLTLVLPSRLAQGPACPAPAAEPPLRRRWWLWTSVAIAVAGVATGSAIATH